MEFFRHCPGCGRRFHIKLVSKKLVDVQTESLQLPRIARPFGEGSRLGSPDLLRSVLPVSVEEGRPILIDVEDFQYKYKCKHCGHEWSEEHIERHREGQTRADQD